MGNFTFKMPDIGEGVVEAEITAWHVSVGDTVSEEDPIADAMTDKATIELTSPVDGIITALGCEAGDMLAVGAALATFTVEGETEDEMPSPIERAKDNRAEEKSKAPSPSKHETKPAKSAKSTKSTNSANSAMSKRNRRSGDLRKPLASPAVRKRAREAGLNLADATPTGASGQVTHIDLDRLEDTLQPLEGETRIKVIGLRRVIAERMQASKRHIPHFTYVDEVDVTDLESLRARANENASEDKPKLTVLPFIIRALGLTLLDWPQFNARYMDEQGFVSQFTALNLGLATMTDKGLIVPVIKDAGRKSIWQLARDIARLSEAARSNTLSPEDLTGASTTLTSLGPLGGIVTTPVINRPEVAIFGPNKIRDKLELREGELTMRRVMNVSISCDHRVIDGYDAAAMMQDLKRLLEEPERMFF